jgi:hypothetical protein
MLKDSNGVRKQQSCVAGFGKRDNGEGEELATIFKRVTY